MVLSEDRTFSPYVWAACRGQAKPAAKRFYNRHMESKVTREMVKRYESVRSSGRYNMVMNASDAAAEIGCDIQTYFQILDNYSELMKKFDVKRVD